MSASKQAAIETLNSNKDKLIEHLENENRLLKEKLQKYTDSRKKYYENNKEKINEQKRIYQRERYQQKKLEAAAALQQQTTVS